MLSYFIMFFIIGAVLGFIFKNQMNKAIAVVIAISVFWIFAFSAKWGIVSFFEMLMGYAVINKVMGVRISSLSRNTENSSRNSENIHDIVTKPTDGIRANKYDDDLF